MMTSITARRAAVIDPSPRWLYRVGSGWGDGGGAPAGTAGLEGGPGVESPDC